jgi:hypothetical protein
MKTLRFAVLAFLGIASALAQTATPSTTLCAAVTDTKATSVCLASTTNVVKGTGLYVDLEFMTVLATPSGTTNVPVSVARGNKSGNAGPALHANSQIVWLALTPDKSTVPGSNGFSFGSDFGEFGPCTRANFAYLPHIWPARGIKRDCAGGSWVNFSEFGANSVNDQLIAITASGAITPTGGNYVITKSSAAAVMTLAAPTSGVQNGAVLHITSSTTQAHTITATGLLGTGSASVNVATFAAFAGSGVTLVAFNGKWLVVSSVGVTFS